MALTFLALLGLHAATAMDWAEARATIPALADYVTPGDPRDLLAWAAEGERLTLWTRDGAVCRALDMERGTQSYLGRVDACTLEREGLEPVIRSCELSLGIQAWTSSCADGGQALDRQGASIALALVLADGLSAQYAPAVQLQAVCPRVERLQSCTDGSQRVCSSSPGCSLLERGPDGLITVREATVQQGGAADCSQPCDPGIVDPEGVAADINLLLGERSFVPLDPARGVAVYESEALCLADASWGESLLDDPSCVHDRLAARTEDAWAQCVKPREKELGIDAEIQILVGPNGRVMALDLLSDARRASLWRSCLLDALERFEAGTGPQGHAWTYTEARTLTSPE